MNTGLLLLPLFVLTLCFPASAQIPHANLLLNRDSIIYAHRPHNLAKNTNTAASRLIAESSAGYQDTAFIPGDSTYFIYSGNRGGDPAQNVLDYDTAFYDGTDNNVSPPLVLRTQTFDANNNVLTNTFQNWNTVNHTYVNYDKLIVTYDNNNNILTSISQLWDSISHNWVNSDKSIYTYDGNNNCLNSISQWWNSATNSWVNSEKETGTYDNNNNVITSLDQVWDTLTNSWTNAQLYTTTYTTANKESSTLTQFWQASGWVNDFENLFTYNSNNYLLSQLTLYWNVTNNNWDSTDRYLYTYDAMNNQLTWVNQNWTSGIWINIETTIDSNYIAGMPQAEVNMFWDAGTGTWSSASGYAYRYTYNSYNQMTSYTEQSSFVNGAWQSVDNDFQFLFYYQTYDLAVNPVSNTSGGSARIYPVPAQSELHIDLTWDEPQACNIALFDVQGRVLKQWQVPSTSKYNSMISVSDLAAGNYFISITGATGRIVQKLVVSK